MPTSTPSGYYSSTFSMPRSLLFFGLLLILFPACWSPADGSGGQEDPERPNIVVFYVDDLGYGDVGCYGATAVETPNIDKLAARGVRFTDGHCAAATCTPSRYALLTGRYAFRNEAAVLPGDAPLIIDTAILTLPKMLKQAGYKTAVVGKWHLGLGDGNTDWNTKVSPGPEAVGFDYNFLLPATGDRVPTVYLEQGKVVGLTPQDSLRISYTGPINDEPTGLSNPELLRVPADEQHAKSINNGVSRIGYQTGGKAAMWVDEEFPDVFTQKANQFIAANKDEPFFLYFPFHDIHVPRLPHPRFEGSSSMGPRGDAIAQVDWMTGAVVAELERQGILDNTLIIFTSDNGPVLDDGYADEAIALLGEHQPAGPFSGGKYSSFEAGTRVPTIVCGPDVWQVSGGLSPAVLNQVDLLASLADLVGISIPEDAGLDSENHLRAWLGHSASGREEMIQEAYTLALRQGDWKYIAPSRPGAGSWIKDSKGNESGMSELPQLYDLNQDPAERNNLAAVHPERTAAMHADLLRLVGSDKTRRLYLPE